MLMHYSHHYYDDCGGSGRVHPPQHRNDDRAIRMFVPNLVSKCHIVVAVTTWMICGMTMTVLPWSILRVDSMSHWPHVMR